MTATDSAVDRATPRPATVRFDVISAWAAERGATTDMAIAELLGIHRATLSRFKNGQLVPSLPRALSIAAIVGVPVEEVVPVELIVARAA